MLLVPWLTWLQYDELGEMVSMVFPPVVHDSHGTGIDVPVRFSDKQYFAATLPNISDSEDDGEV